MSSTGTNKALQAVRRFRIREFQAANRNRPFYTVKGKEHDLQNPFVPHKSNSGKWIAPQYSLRRQADLVKKAKASNTLQLLPPGPKLNDPKAAAQALSLRNTEKKIQSLRLNGTESSPTSEPSSSTVKPSLEPLLEESKVDLREPHPADEDPLVVGPFKAAVNWVGNFTPKRKDSSGLGIRLYAGKKRMFKGHTHERLRPRKEAYRKVLLRGMNRRIDAYKNTRRSKVPHPLSVPRGTRTKLPF